MINFNDVKSILESLGDLVKKSATLDLQEKIVDLREYIISLKDENITLKENNQTLKLKLEATRDFNLKDGLYWKEGDSVPFCQPCLDGSQKRIHLQHWAENWKCFECQQYFPPPDKAGRVQFYKPNLGRDNYL